MPLLRSPAPAAAPDLSFDLDWITDQIGVGGALPDAGAHRLAQSERVQAVVDLRAEACDDEGALKAAGIAFLHLPTPDLQAVSQGQLDQGVAFAHRVLDGGGRVLIHCQHGIGRSALLALCVLADRGVAPAEAILRAKNARERVSPSPEQYEAWATWLRRRGMAPPRFDLFAAIAYRHLQTA